MFAVPCTIGKCTFENCMIDLGASINILPYSAYKKSGIGPLKETRIVVQMADSSTVHPEGMVEDVLVKVNGLLFPTNFYILRTHDAERILSDSSSIILGLPFLNTAYTKIDVHSGTLTMEFADEKIVFNFFDKVKNQGEYLVAGVGTYNDLEEELGKCIEEYIDEENARSFESKYEFIGGEIEGGVEENKCGEILHETGNVEHACHVEKLQDELTIPRERMQPSIKIPLVLELKLLPSHLKYAYLGEKETLPVIISSYLNPEQEGKLLTALQAHKKAIGWTLVDIPGISPSTCMHWIVLEEDAKPSREPQRRLNPPMMEVVKKELLKLLDAGIIYSVADSKWVAPIHVVPKKAGINLVENKEGKQVLT